MIECTEHKKEILCLDNMEQLAEMIGNLHYETLTELLYHLSQKIDADAENDNKRGRDKLASALQYAGMSIFESALRIEKCWKISKPFMK